MSKSKQIWTVHCTVLTVTVRQYSLHQYRHLRVHENYTQSASYCTCLCSRLPSLVVPVTVCQYSLLVPVPHYQPCLLVKVLVYLPSPLSLFLFVCRFPSLGISFPVSLSSPPNLCYFLSIYPAFDTFGLGLVCSYLSDSLLHLLLFVQSFFAFPPSFMHKPYALCWITSLLSCGSSNPSHIDNN